MEQLEKQPRVVVLLALYNGSTHIAEQIDSIVTQTKPPHTIIVSDDGSSDNSLEIVQQKAAQYPDVQFKTQQGPKAGYAANFFSLLASAPDDADYVALSDQDDVWLPTKIERALDQMPSQTEPVLYGSCVWVVNAELQNRKTTRQMKVPPSFKHALTQNYAPGNSMVLNNTALHLMKTAVRNIGPMPVHDWWIYQLIAGAGGTIIHDAEPQVLYRQHGDNAIGANTGLKAVTMRIAALIGGEFQAWNDANFAALDVNRDLLTPDSRQVLSTAMSARNLPLTQRVTKFRKLGLVRQGKMGKASLWLAILLKRY